MYDNRKLSTIEAKYMAIIKTCQEGYLAQNQFWRTQ